MRLRRLLEAHWWRRHHAWAGLVLVPMSWLYALLVGARALAYRLGWRHAARVPVPVVVVGNLVVGGAGKTPTTIALVQALRAAGWCPGVVSRGYGSGRREPRPVTADAHPLDCGDEPLLIRRRTGAPVWVGADRVAAATALCARHPEVDVLVSDDGLQHRRLAREVEVIVFDDRGLGNARLLPAGPLRERPGSHPPTGAVVVYNAARPSMHWPGPTLSRRLGTPVPLSAWWEGKPSSPSGAWPTGADPIPAAAGIGEPERFFRMLEAAGVRITRHPLPDHAPWDEVPWPAGPGPVLVTEKDAVKLSPAHPDAARIHVVPLDFEWPAEALARVLDRLPRRRAALP